MVAVAERSVSATAARARNSGVVKVGAAAAAGGGGNPSSKFRGGWCVRGKEGKVVFPAVRFSEDGRHQ